MSAASRLCPVRLNVAALVGIAWLAAVGGASAAAPDAAPAPAGKTSFAEVTRQLQPGGEFYLYVSGAKWGAGVLQAVDALQALASAKAGEPEAQQSVEAGLAIARRLVGESGLTELSGVGLSSVLGEAGMYEGTAVFHHYPGRGGGVFWQALGGEPGELEGLRLLPAATVLAAYGRLDLRAIWQWWNLTFTATGTPDMKANYDRMRAGFATRTGADLDRVLDSTAGEVGIVVTVHPERKRTVAGRNGATLDVPDAAAAVLVKTSDDTLFQLVARQMASAPGLIRGDEADLKMLTVPARGPLPLDLAPSAAQFGPYFVLATNPDLVREMLAVVSGTKPGLAAEPEFAALARGLPTQGVGFGFIGQRFGRALQDLARLAAQQGAGMDSGALAAMGSAQGAATPAAGYAVVQTTAEGLVVHGHSTSDAAQALVVGGAVTPVAILAGIALPALGQARGNARRVACMSNLKQIGLGLHMCAQDQHGRFPDRLADIGRYVEGGRVWQCPGAAAPATGPADSSYVYYGAGLVLAEVPEPSRTVLAAERPGNHPPRGLNVLFVDGHVQTTMAASLEEAAKAGRWVIPQTGAAKP